MEGRELSLEATLNLVGDPWMQQYQIKTVTRTGQNGGHFLHMIEMIFPTWHSQELIIERDLKFMLTTPVLGALRWMVAMADNMFYKQNSGGSNHVTLILPYI